METSVWKKNWDEVRNSSEAREEIRESLKFNYQGNECFEEAIIDALIFWNFIRKNLTGESWKTRRNFLKDFSYDIEQKKLAGRLQVVVAMIESLPDSLWRKILWKYNLDFMSFESFLRRLTHEQTDAIVRNYRELFEKNEIPEAFSWFDRFWRKISRDGLLADKINKEQRYQSKGAISYNLLGLDFGFNAYSKGVKDDTKVVEISPLRFLSRKEHADDFIVKQEDGGKYWWLYRKARSNYVWRSERQVKLKTHICPGFWYTFFIHALFWVISPVTFTAVALSLISGLSWFKIALLALFSLTPLWLLAATIKMAWKFLIVPSVKTAWKFAVNCVFARKTFVFLTEKLWLKQLNEWAKEKSVYDALLGILAGVILTTVAVAALRLGADIVEGVRILLAYLGIHWIIFVAIPGWVLARILLHMNKDEEIVVFLRALSLFFAALSFGVILWSSQVRHFLWLVMQTIADVILRAFLLALELVANFFVFVAQEIAYLFATVWLLLGPLVFLILLPLAFLALVIWAGEKMSGKKSEIFFDWLDKAANWLRWISAGFFLLMLVLSVFGSDSGSGYLYLALALLALVVSAVFLVVLHVERGVNPKIVRYKDMVDHYGLGYLGINHKKLMKNPSFERDDWGSWDIEEFKAILSNLFSDEKERKSVARIFIPRLNPGIMKRLPAPGSKKYTDILSGIRFRVLVKVFAGLDFQQAVAFAEKDLLRAQAAKKKDEEFADKVFEILCFAARKVAIPFVLLGKAIYWFFWALAFVVKKAIEIFITFWRLKYELFNERCPYVSKPRNLSYEKTND